MDETEREKLESHEMANDITCKYCGKELLRPSSRILHERRHTGEKPFACSICEFRSAQSIALKQHMNTHSGEKLFECNICDYRAANKNRLEEHMVVHTNERQYKCEHCDKGFKSSISCQRHMKTHTGVHSCNICKTACATNRDLKRHLLRHNDRGQTFECRVCQEQFRDRILFVAHKKTHKCFQDNECDICGATFTVLNEFVNHKEWHRREKATKSMCCDRCGDSNFKTKKAFQTHLQIHVRAERIAAHACDLRYIYCNETFEHGVALVRHISEKHPEMVRVVNYKNQYKCPSCEQFCNGKYSKFLQHYRSHTGETPFECELCPKKFAFVGTFRQHKKYHLKEKPFACNDCPKKFASEFLFHSHVKSHLKEHRCKYCDVSLPYECARVKHESSHLDSNGKIYFKCEECSLNLKSGPEYPDHYMKHYKKRPFGCTQCDRRFKSKNYRKAHMRWAHKGEKPFGNKGKCSRDTLFKKKDRTILQKLQTGLHTSDTEKGHSSDICEISDEEDTESTPSILLLQDLVESSTKTSSTIEYSSLPLSVIVYRRGIANSNEVMLIWLEKLEPDIIQAVKDTNAKCIVLCRQLKKKQKMACLPKTKATFGVESSNAVDTESWQHYSIGCTEIFNKLKEKQFKSYKAIEEAIGNSIDSNNLINIIRYSERDLFNDMAEKFHKNIIISNCNF